MNKLILAITSALVLSACAGPQTMYSWGEYEETLFVNYHEPAMKEKALTDYIEFVDSGGTTDRPLAPGLYAEAGTFMLEQGNTEDALKYYRMEYENWPESRPMMGVLIENLEGQIDE